MACVGAAVYLDDCGGAFTRLMLDVLQDLVDNAAFAFIAHADADVSDEARVKIFHGHGKNNFCRDPPYGREGQGCVVSLLFTSTMSWVAASR